MYCCCISVTNRYWKLHSFKWLFQTDLITSHPDWQVIVSLVKIINGDLYSSKEKEERFNNNKLSNNKAYFVLFFTNKNRMFRLLLSYVFVDEKSEEFLLSKPGISELPVSRLILGFIGRTWNGQREPIITLLEITWSPCGTLYVIQLLLSPSTKHSTSDYRFLWIDILRPAQDSLWESCLFTTTVAMQWH